MFWTTAAHAMGSAGAGGDGGPAQWSQLGLMVMVFAVFYFILIRPQQKKAKEQRALLDNLRVGDKVVTTGGVQGVIAELGESTVKLNLGDSTIIIGRSFIAGPPPYKHKKKGDKSENEE